MRLIFNEIVSKKGLVEFKKRYNERIACDKSTNGEAFVFLFRGLIKLHQRIDYIRYEKFEILQIKSFVFATIELRIEIPVKYILPLDYIIHHKQLTVH